MSCDAWGGLNLWSRGNMESGYNSETIQYGLLFLVTQLFNILGKLQKRFSRWGVLVLLQKIFAFVKWLGQTGIVRKLSQELQAHIIAHLLSTSGASWKQFSLCHATRTDKGTHVLDNTQDVYPRLFAEIDLNRINRRMKKKIIPPCEHRATRPPGVWSQSKRRQYQMPRAIIGQSRYARRKCQAECRSTRG